MKGLLSRRPSPALIVAMVALVVAMAGTGYAAFKLPKNSVGTKQLKPNSVTTAKIKKKAVTGAKVKDKTLTGKDINLNKLGTVPSANLANVANSLAPAEPTHLVGTPGQPAFEGGSSNAPTETSGIRFNSVGFYKDHEGIVHLEGVAKVGTEGRIFTLPAGYRPPSGVLLVFEPTDENSAIVVGSNTNVEGTVLDGLVLGSTAGELVSLDGITYRAGS